MIEYTVKAYAKSNDWFLNGERHREDGPAIEWAHGSKEWYLNGKRHREDGPAVDRPSGFKVWYLNGKCHREDGPAVDHVRGPKAWYLNDKCLTEEEHRQQTQSCAGKIVEIDGKKYKLTEV